MNVTECFVTILSGETLAKSPLSLFCKFVAKKHCKTCILLLINNYGLKPVV